MQPKKITEAPLLSANECDEIEPVNNFLIWSIINNVCCICTCGLTLICSIPALVFSLNVDTERKRRKNGAAKRNSVLAFLMNTATLVSIFILITISIIFWIYIVYYSAKGVEWFCDLPLNWTC